MTDNLLNVLEKFKTRMTDKEYKNAIEDLGKLEKLKPKSTKLCEIKFLQTKIDINPESVGHADYFLLPNNRIIPEIFNLTDIVIDFINEELDDNDIIRPIDIIPTELENDDTFKNLNNYLWLGDNNLCDSRIHKDNPLHFHNKMTTTIIGIRIIN